MDTGKIEVLLRAIELGSLSKAANEYLYTPSAVSHILDGIENELGAKFIRRSYKGIEIEPGCEEVVENLKQLVNIQKRTVQLLSDKQKRKTNLTVATYASLSKYVLPKIIKGFNSEFPDINVSVLVDEKLQRVYEECKADLVMGEKFEDESICWEELMTDPFVAVFPKSRRFVGNTVSREELYKQAFVMANDEKISEYIDESRMNDIMKIDSHDDSSIVYMVKEGLGVAVLPLLSVKEEDDVVLAGLEPEFARTLGLAYRQGDFKKNKALRSFIDYIRKFDFRQII